MYTVYTLSILHAWYTLHIIVYIVIFAHTVYILVQCINCTRCIRVSTLYILYHELSAAWTTSINYPFNTGATVDIEILRGMHGNGVRRRRCTTCVDCMSIYIYMLTYTYIYTHMQVERETWILMMGRLLQGQGRMFPDSLAGLTKQLQWARVHYPHSLPAC